MASRVCTTAPRPDRETVHNRIHTAAVRACADQSQSNPLPQYARNYAPRFRPDSTPAQNTLRTQHPHVREIQTSSATPGFRVHADAAYGGYFALGSNLGEN